MYSVLLHNQWQTDESNTCRFNRRDKNSNALLGRLPAISVCSVQYCDPNIHLASFLKALKQRVIEYIAESIVIKSRKNCFNLKIVQILRCFTEIWNEMEEEIKSLNHLQIKKKKVLARSLEDLLRHQQPWQTVCTWESCTNILSFQCFLYWWIHIQLV